MSFPKASIKRFNEAAGCAPPPTAYDPKSGEKATGGVVDKSERFKTSKDVGPGSANSSTPVKQLFAPPQSIKKSAKTSSAETTKIKELEKQIKHLLKERTDQDKLLGSKDDELKKLEGRLLNANSDKSSLQAKLAAAEKELQATKKSNEILKNKISAADNSKKYDTLQTEVTSLKQQLHHKDQEISQLKRDLHLVMTVVISDLRLFESNTVTLEKCVETYSTLVTTHKSSSEAKGSTNKKQKNGINKLEDIEDKLKNDKLTVEEKISVIKKQSQLLRDRFTRAVQDLESLNKTLESNYTAAVSKQTELQATLKKVETELQEALKTKKALEEQKADLLDSNGCLNDKIKELMKEARSKEENIRILQSNLEQFQAGNNALQAKLSESENLHLQTHKEDADRIITLEERELVIQVVTKGLNERIIELQTQNEDLLATLRRTEETLAQVKTENQNLEESLADLKQQFNQEKAHFVVQFEELEKEKLKVDNSLNDSEKKIAELQSDLDRTASEADVKIKELHCELESNRSELEQLQNKLGDLVYEKSQLHMEIGHMEAKLKLLNCESEKTKEDADKAIAVIPHLKEEINTLLIEKKNVEDRIVELTEHNSGLQRTLEVFQSDFDVYVEGAEKDKEDLNHKIVELTEEIDGLKEQKDHMAKELDEWLVEKSELDIDVAKLQCRIKVLEMENEQSSSEAEKEAKIQKNEILKLKDEKQNLEQQLTNKGTEIESLQEEKQRMLKEYSNLEKRTQDLETVVEEKAGQVEVTLRELEELKQICDSKSADCTSRDEKCKQLELTVEEQIEQLHLRDRQTEDLQKQLRSKSADHSVLEEKINSLESTVNKQAESLQDTEQQLKDLQRQFDSKSTDCTALEEKNSSLELLVKKQTEKLQDTEKQLGNLQEQYDSKSSGYTLLEEKTCSLESLVKKQTETLQDTERQLAALQEQYDSKCEECDGLTESKERLQGDLSILSKTMTVIETKLEQVQEDLARKCEECETLSKKNEELDIELTLSAKETVDFQERIDSLLSENEKLQVYEAEVEDLRQQLAFFSKTETERHKEKEEAEKYKKLYDDLLARVEPFIEQIEAYELEKQFLLGRSQATEEEMQKLQQNYCDLLGHQNKKQKIKHIVKLKDENSALRKEVEKLREQFVRQQRALEKSSLTSSLSGAKGKENAPSKTPLKSRQQTEKTGK